MTTVGTVGPKTIERLHKAEVLHDCWAMLGTLWCLTPEQPQTYIIIDNGASKVVWFKAGAKIFKSYGLKYVVAPVLVSAQTIFAVLACQLVSMSAFEAYRVNGGPFGGRDLELVNPGGKRFDLLGLADKPEMAAELKVKEIKNGRLGIFSMFGYYVQAAVTGQSPIENWVSHIVDPFAVNGLTLEIAAQYTPSVVMFVDARKKKGAAPKVDLSDWCGPDQKKWLGPSAADSDVSDYLTGEYPGDYGWDSAELAAGPKAFERVCG